MLVNVIAANVAQLIKLNKSFNEVERKLLPGKRFVFVDMFVICIEFTSVEDLSTIRFLLTDPCIH